MMVVLEIRFLDGYHAATPDGNREWPPTPQRLHSALVNFHYVGQRRQSISPAESQAEKEALLFLENQTAPDIYFAQQLNQNDSHSWPGPVVTYVPLNEYEPGAWFKYPNRRERSAPNGRHGSFPVVYPASPYVYFCWPLADANNLHWKSIAKIVKYLDQLGNSRTTVITRLLDTLPEQAKKLTHLVPTPMGNLRLPCYHPNRLAILDDAYKLGVRAVDGGFVSYGDANAKIKETPINLFQTTTIFALQGAYRLGIKHSSLLADAIRSKLLKLAYQSQIEPVALIAKEKTPHMAYHALPFVGQHGNGTIMGMAISIPEEIPPAEALACQQVLSQLQSFNYKNEEWMLIPVDNNKQLPHTLQLDTWRGPSKYWLSVTPAEISWNVHNDEYIANLCQLLGLPIKKVSTGPHPNFNGVPLSQEFFVRNRLKTNRKMGFLTHMRLEFSRPISGPLAISHSANFSLGLCRPDE